MIPLQRKYGRAIELAEQGGIDSPPEEHEGRLYLIGTLRSPGDVARVWDAIREIPDWDSEVIADVRSADFAAAIATFAAQPRRILARAVTGSPAESGLLTEPLRPPPDVGGLADTGRPPVLSAVNRQK